MDEVADMADVKVAVGNKQACVWTRVGWFVFGAGFREHISVVESIGFSWVRKEALNLSADAAVALFWVVSRSLTSFSFLCGRLVPTCFLRCWNNIENYKNLG